MVGVEGVVAELAELAELVEWEVVDFVELVVLNKLYVVPKHGTFLPWIVAHVGRAPLLHQVET